jgi:hypothetical protein
MGVTAAVVDAGTTSAEEDPNGPIDFKLPKSMSKPKPARAPAPSGICAAIAPGHKQHFNSYLVCAGVLACGWLRRHRARVKARQRHRA